MYYVLTFPVRPDCDQHHVPRWLWLLPIDRTTVTTSEVPVKMQAHCNQLHTSNIANSMNAYRKTKTQVWKQKLSLFDPKPLCSLSQQEEEANILITMEEKWDILLATHKKVIPQTYKWNMASKSSTSVLCLTTVRWRVKAIVVVHRKDATQKKWVL